MHAALVVCFIFFARVSNQLPLSVVYKPLKMSNKNQPPRVQAVAPRAHWLPKMSHSELSSSSISERSLEELDLDFGSLLERPLEELGLDFGSLLQRSLEELGLDFGSVITAGRPVHASFFTEPLLGAGPGGERAPGAVRGSIGTQFSPCCCHRLPHMSQMR